MEYFKRLYDDYYNHLLLRYDILNLICHENPIGRRLIANTLKQNERSIRNECDYLSRSGLVHTVQTGMYITEEGRTVLDELQDFIFQLRKFDRLEMELQEKLHVKSVNIAPDDEDEVGTREFGTYCANFLLRRIKTKKVLGITGGTTINKVIDNLHTNQSFEDLTVISARGGLGGNPMTESNLLAYRLKEKLNSKYSGIYLPDVFDETQIDEKYVDQKDPIRLLKEIDVLFFGIGNAMTMAKKRHVSKERMQHLKKDHAVAEAFGCYFDLNGKLVYESKSLGLNFHTFLKIPSCIAVAGIGKEDAVRSIASLRNDLELVVTKKCANNLYKTLFNQQGGIK